MERAFVASQTELFVHRMMTTCFLTLAMIFFVLLFNVIVVKQHLRESFSSDMAFDTTKVSLFVLIIVGVLISLCLGIMHCKPLLRALTPAGFEWFVMGGMCFFMAAFVLRTPDRITNMMGESVAEVFAEKYYSDSHVLLMIDMFVTVSHLGFPARWISMLPLEVSSIMLYLVLILGIGSHEPMVNNVFSVGNLSILVTFSALGKRAAEIKDRQHFMEIIKERSLRCEAEFELSRSKKRGSKSQDQLSESRRTNGDSAPGTTPGSQAFNLIFEEDVDLSVQLRHVMELGDAEHWRIEEQEVKVLPDKVLGRGGFGQVLMGIFCGVMVAVKLPHDSLASLGRDRLPDLCNELRVLRHVRHPNIVGIHGAIINPLTCKIALIMELIRGVSLHHFVMSGSWQEQGRQPDAQARYSAILGVCNALLYLHTRRPLVVHGDIKSSNIMVQLTNGSAHAKVLDFGLSRVITRHPRPLGGSLAYLPPEIFLRDGVVRCSADVYSFGRLLAFVFTSKLPLSGMTKEEVVEALKMRKPPPPEWPPGCVFEPFCRELVQGCLRAEEKARPGIREVHHSLLGLSRDLGLVNEHGHLLERVKASQREAEPKVGLGRDAQQAPGPEREGKLRPIQENPPSSSSSVSSEEPEAQPEVGLECEDSTPPVPWPVGTLHNVQKLSLGDVASGSSSSCASAGAGGRTTEGLGDARKMHL